MNYRETMKALKTHGTAQNRKVYARHGATDPMFGVSYKNLNALKKKIKTDPALAEQLWQSGNHDARILATMITDPAALKSSDIDRWAKDLTDYPVSDALAKLVSTSPHAVKKMEKWLHARSEWTGRTGWMVATHLAGRKGALTDARCAQFLQDIEANIHGAKNRVKDAMNGTLIQIGLRSDKLEKKAVAAAKRIGTVDVDHGETGCKTPDAVEYIARAKVRARARYG